MATSWISYDEILRLKQIEEVLELYYNSGQFTHTIHEMEKHFPSAFAMYEQLADWYETHDCFGFNPRGWFGMIVCWVSFRRRTRSGGTVPGASDI